MSHGEITQKNGYRLEDLPEEGKKTISNYEDFIEDMVSGMEYIIGGYEDTIIDQIKKEAVQEAFLELEQQMCLYKDELQIVIAEETMINSKETEKV